MECSIILDKTQLQIENEYYWIDLPDLITKKNEHKAASLLNDIEVATFPHITDEKVRKSIWDKYQKRLPQGEPEKPLSAEAQYERLKRRMSLGGG